MTRHHHWAALAVIVCALLPTAGQAAAKKDCGAANRATAPMRFTADAPEVLKAVTVEALSAECKEGGLDPKLGKDDAGDPCLTVTYKGVKAIILFYGKDGKYESLALTGRWSTDKPPVLAVANTWNSEERFTRAYVDDKDYVLESDLDLAGGVTMEAIGRFVGYYMGASLRFAKAIAPEG